MPRPKWYWVIRFLHGLKGLPREPRKNTTDAEDWKAFQATLAREYREMVDPTSIEATPSLKQNNSRTSQQDSLHKMLP